MFKSLSYPLATRVLGGAVLSTAVACSSGTETVPDREVTEPGGETTNSDSTDVSSDVDTTEVSTTTSGDTTNGDSPANDTTDSTDSTDHSEPSPGTNMPAPDPSQTSFESDNPVQEVGFNEGAAGGGGAVPDAAPGAAPGAPANDGAADGGGEAARAIEEADIIKVEGDRLYALSQYGGLNVVDVSKPEQLQLLGRHKVVATPFEMYVRDGVAMVLYNGYGEYTETDDGNYTFYQTSYVVILDTTSPDAITELGRFEVPGYVQDSRIVGNILYVASYENGYCWNCDSDPTTNLISLDVTDPTAITQVDELSFSEREDTYSWKRSLSSTNERFYIAGPSWGDSEPEGSTIQVVDISDPGGDMVLGDSVVVSGQIESRWQMDEHEGVLRVVSQPFTWRTDQVPVVDTFTVVSSAELEPLGSVDMVLPRPERLMSARFDGDRGYAITFERTDPLFTLDLSDPANPKQTGELEMPGWVYHMEPRGDRLLGLGYDQGNEEGALTVSLFDVSDMSAPSMIDRVNFGGDWAWLSEDQDRIHKAFRVLDDSQLVLVPFSGNSYTADDGCARYEYVSGVQLVDWANDELDLRGVARSVGQARRGFLHEDRLFTISDDRVQTFDVSDRDEPTELQSLALALKVDQVAVTGDTVLRVGQDWYSGVPQLDVTTVAGVGQAAGLAQLQLPQPSNDDECSSSSYLQQVVATKDAAHLVYLTYSYDQTSGTGQYTYRVRTVDVSDPQAPDLAGDVDLDFNPTYRATTYGMADSGQFVVGFASALAFTHYEDKGHADGKGVSTALSVKVVDLGQPDAPVVHSVALPDMVGATGLLHDGDTLALSHYEAVEGDKTGKVRFFIDRIDVSNPQAPEALPKVNVPGSLLAYDAQSNRAVTVDYRKADAADVSANDCYEKMAGTFQYPQGVSVDENTLGTCTTITQTLNLVEIDEDHLARVLARHELEAGEQVGLSALGDDRLFIGTGRFNYYYGGLLEPGLAPDVAVGGGIGGGYYYPFASGSAKVLALSNLRTGALSVTELELESGDQSNGSIQHLAASGKRAIVASGWRGRLTVLAAEGDNALDVVRDVELAGYVSDLDVVDGVAVVSLGYDGAQAIPLTD